MLALEASVASRLEAVASETSTNDAESRKTSLSNGRIRTENDQPCQLPPGWEMKTSRTTGKIYYANEKFKISQFERPTISQNEELISAMNVKMVEDIDAALDAQMIA